ncbi:SecDF P1 head subdomain-containing protein [Actinomadura napierensis]|uniref:SecDF P1 head subdomain domain-containing protein n=1 Tax=Actinomadura napierensis TaxID=267854 RepID=A0ABN2ZPC9_9ACTN
MGQPPDDPSEPPKPPEPFRPPPPIYAPPPSDGPPPPPFAPPPGYGPAPGAPPAAYPLLGSGGQAPPETRSRRAPLLLLAGGAALVAVLLIAGAVTYLATRGDDGGDGDDGGPAALRQPMVLQQVAEVSQAPCAAGTLPEASGTSCYRLAGGGMTVRLVRHMKAVPPAGGTTSWAIQMELTEADARAFADLSGQAARQAPGSPANRIAMVVGGRVLSAPAVTGGPITGGSVQISGRFTRSGAEDLIARITGRRPS